MNVGDILNVLDRVWEALPMPYLFLYVIAFGLLWLFIEYQVTRVSRRTPGVRRPFPLLPWISEVTVYLIRGSSWLMWLWALLYFSVVGVVILMQLGVDMPFADALMSIVSAWQRAYAFLIGLLPQFVTELLPGI